MWESLSSFPFRFFRKFFKQNMLSKAMLKAANFNHITVPRLPKSHTVQSPHTYVIIIRPNYRARQNRIQNNKCDGRTQMKHSMLTFISLPTYIKSGTPQCCGVVCKRPIVIKSFTTKDTHISAANLY